MAGSLDSSVLHEFTDGRVEVCWVYLPFRSKTRVVPGVTLNAYSPALLGHAKNKGPSIFRVQVCVGKHK